MKPVFLWALYGLILSTPVAADEWVLSGFINQTAIYTSDNYFFGKTDDNVSVDYRELALLGSGPVAGRLDFAAQILSRKAGVASDGEPALDFGFFSWRFYENFSFTHGLRFGRLKTPIGFYNDTRESPFTRNSIFLPQSIYLDRGRNYVMRADELMYFGEWRADSWTLNWKLAAGKTVPDEDELVDFFHLPAETNPHFKSSNAWHASFLGEYDGGRIRLGVSTHSSPNKYSLNLTILQLGQVEAEAKTLWQIVSFEYNDPRWSFTSEYELATFDYNGSSPDPLNPDYKDYPQAGYMQFLWHASPKQDVFIRREFFHFNKHDPSGSHNETLLGSMVTGSTRLDRYGFATVLGWGYRPAVNWLLRAEWAHNRGGVWSTQRDAPTGVKLRKSWDLASLAVSWRF